jgi:hypothetical protein
MPWNAGKRAHAEGISLTGFGGAERNTGRGVE